MDWSPPPVVGEITFICPDLSNFRAYAHGPCRRTDDISTPSGAFVTRVGASVTTDDHRPDRWAIPPSLSLWVRVLLHSPRTAQTLQKPEIPPQLTPNLLPSRQAGEYFTPVTDLAASVSSSLSNPVRLTLCRLRTASPPDEPAHSRHHRKNASCC